MGLEDAAPELPSEKGRTVLIPEYADRFRDACRELPAALAASAIKAIAEFAAYDTAVWRHARALKQRANLYRVRIGIHHRLMLRWLPGKSLVALDLISREDFDAWVRRYRG